RCAQNSNCALQNRPVIRIAISLSAAGIDVWNRTYSPTLCTRSATSGLRSNALKGPAAPLRGPDTIPRYTSRWRAVIVVAVRRGKRRAPSAGFWERSIVVLLAVSDIVLSSAPPSASGGVPARHAACPNEDAPSAGNALIDLGTCHQDYRTERIGDTARRP